MRRRFGALSICEGKTGQTQVMMIEASLMRSATSSAGVEGCSVMVYGKLNFGVGTWRPSRTTMWCDLKPDGRGGGVSEPFMVVWYGLEACSGCGGRCFLLQITGDVERSLLCRVDIKCGPNVVLFTRAGPSPEKCKLKLLLWKIPLWTNLCLIRDGGLGDGVGTVL